MKILSYFFILFLLTACSSLLTSREDINHFYVLNPIDEIIKVQNPAEIHLWVREPTMQDWLDDERIILRKGNNKVDFYAEARWATTTGSMIHELIVQSLEANHVATDVILKRTNVAPDYQLDIEVLAMQAEYKKSNKPPEVHIAIRGKLMAMPSGKVSYEFKVENTTQAKQNTMSHIIKAFDLSMQACLNEIVIRTAEGLAVE